MVARRSSLIALLLSLSAAPAGIACSRGGDSNQGPKTYRYTLDISAGLSEGRLIRDGKDVAEVKVGRATLDVAEPTWLGASDLRFRVATTCGPKDLPITGLSHIEEEAARRRAHRVGGGRWEVDGISVRHKGVPMRILYLDNRAGPATTLRVGRMDHPVAAKSTTTFVVPLGDCADAKNVSIGGSALGALTGDKANVIDVKGGQCSVLREVRYAAPGMPTRGSERTQRLTGKRIYDAPFEITWLFRPPPDKLEGRNAAGAFMWALEACP